MNKGEQQFNDLFEKQFEDAWNDYRSKFIFPPVNLELLAGWFFTRGAMSEVDRRMSCSLQPNPAKVTP